MTKTELEVCCAEDEGSGCSGFCYQHTMVIVTSRQLTRDLGIPHGIIVRFKDAILLLLFDKPNVLIAPKELIKQSMHTSQNCPVLDEVNYFALDFYQRGPKFMNARSQVALDFSQRGAFAGFDLHFISCRPVCRKVSLIISKFVKWK